MFKNDSQELETPAKANSSVSVTGDVETNGETDRQRDGIRVVCLSCDFEAVWSPEERARHVHDLETEHEVAYESVNDREVRTDGCGVGWRDLNGTQRDMLLAVRAVDASDEEPSGQSIKDWLEANQYGRDEVNHSLLYTNLNSLVEVGLVRKSVIDRRANSYRPTGAALDLLDRQTRRMVDVNGFRRATMTDGGRDGVETTSSMWYCPRCETWVGRKLGECVSEGHSRPRFPVLYEDVEAEDARGVTRWDQLKAVVRGVLR